MDARHYLFGNLQYSAPPPPSARLSSLLTPIHPDQSRRMERISGSWEKHPYEMSTCSLQSNPAVKSTRNQKIPSSCSIFSSWNVLSLQQFHCRGKQRQSTSNCLFEVFIICDTILPQVWEQKLSVFYFWKRQTGGEQWNGFKAFWSLWFTACFVSMRLI